MKLENKFLSVLFLLSIFFIGCTTKIDNFFEFDTEDFKPSKEGKHTKTVFIRNIKDSRKFVFAESTLTPEMQSISSYSPDKLYSKKRIVAREQILSLCSAEDSVANCTASANSFSSLSQNLCFKENDAIYYIKLSIEKGFELAGYQVLDYEDQKTSNTLIVDANLERFWYWIDYTNEDKFAHNEIIVNFSTNQNGIKHSFKIGNHLTTKTYAFLNPLKNTVNQSLVEYSNLLGVKLKEKLN